MKCIRKCIACDADFESIRKNHLICSKKCADKKRNNDPAYLESRRNNPKIKAYTNEYNHRPEVLKKRASYAASSRVNGKFTGWALKHWSDAVKLSYNNTCASCGSLKELEAHHIFSRKDFPEMASLIHNGICLCRSCHIQLHKDIA